MSSVFVRNYFCLDEKKLIKNCRECMERVKSELINCEDWEVKRKQKLQEDLKTLTEIVSDIGDVKCSIRQDGGVHSDRVETRLGAICYGADEVCKLNGQGEPSDPKLPYCY